MGYLSCRARSAAVICESYKKEKKPTKIRVFRYRELELATRRFSSECLLGKGSHGCVYKAALVGGEVVAVKRPSLGVLALREENPGENEIEILSRIQSRRLVNLIGYAYDCNEKLLVVEFMCNGTLYEHLHSNLSPPGWRRRVRFALQTAKAIETLHCANPPVIHRDVKSSNVLIDENWNARLGDFGLALRGHLEDIRVRSTPPAGTIGYLDPGYLTPANLSTKNDVFSFGILLLEIISGRNAIDVNYSPPSIVDWALPLIKRGKLVELYDPRIGPPQDAAARRLLALLAARCIRSSREKRPLISEVVNGLKIVSKSVALPIWNNLTKRIRKLPVNQVLEKNGSCSTAVQGWKTELPASSKQESCTSDPQQRVKTSEEILPKTTKPSGINSLRNTKVSDSDLQSSVGVVARLLSNTGLFDCNSLRNSVGLVNDIKGPSASDLIDQITIARRTGIVVRMPGVRLKCSKSFGTLRTPRLARDTSKGRVSRSMKNPPCIVPRLLSSSDVVGGKFMKKREPM